MAKYKSDTLRTNTAKLVGELKQKGEHVLNAAKQALRLGVERVVDDAKAGCPVRTGTLRDSIHASELDIGLGKGTAYLVQASAIARNLVDYAPYVEFDPRINKPYMYPAITKNRGRIYSLIRTAVEVATRGNG